MQSYHVFVVASEGICHVRALEPFLSLCDSTLFITATSLPCCRFNGFLVVLEYQHVSPCAPQPVCLVLPSQQFVSYLRVILLLIKCGCVCSRLARQKVYFLGESATCCVFPTYIIPGMEVYGSRVCVPNARFVTRSSIYQVAAVIYNALYFGRTALHRGQGRKFERGRGKLS